MKINDYIRGDTRIIQIPCFQSDGTTPLDLTGATVYLTLNASNAPTDDSSDVLQKTATSFIVPAGVLASSGYTVGQNTATLGVAWITIAASDTTNVAPGTYFYDIQVKDASGNISSIKQDTFKINADITRSTA
jgi:hypothetical protein